MQKEGDEFDMARKEDDEMLVLVLRETHCRADRDRRGFSRSRRMVN